ncbi:hypothetical protein [Methylobacterium nodulans]|nr:hypothetical protein [Methylobacterium nodulans]
MRKIASLISHERLATFVAIAGTDRDAIELHRLAMALNGSLSPVLGVIEVALRNATCERLRATFGVPDWLTNPPPPFAWHGEERNAIRRATGQAQRAVYTKKSSADKKALDAIAFPGGVPAGLSHEARSKARQRAIQPTFGQVIAQLTLYFWKRLLSADYDATLWQRSLKRMFPDKSLSRGVVAAQLEVLYQARNRIAHHEPIYGARLAKILQAIEFVAQRFESNHPDPNGILAQMLASYMPGLQHDAQVLEALIARFRVPLT